MIHTHINIYICVYMYLLYILYIYTHIWHIVIIHIWYIYISYIWHIVICIYSYRAIYWRCIGGFWFQVVHPGADRCQHCLGTHCAVSTKWAALRLHPVHYQLLGTTHCSRLLACYFLEESQWAGRFHFCMSWKAALTQKCHSPTWSTIFCMGGILFPRDLKQK